jgi:hypothetical protein
LTQIHVVIAGNQVRAHDFLLFADVGGSIARPGREPKRSGKEAISKDVSDN